MGTRARSNKPGDDDIATAISSYLAGDGSAADELSRTLDGPIRLTAQIFLGDDSADVDDIVQDSIIAVLHYLQKNNGFTGDLIKFAITVARNRCRNLLNWRKNLPSVPIDPMSEWLANVDRSPLDVLLDKEVTSLLQQALDQLPGDCQLILRSFYIDHIPIEKIRRQIGLKTVQGIYYRKSVCLERAYRLLRKRLAICSSGRGESPIR